MPAFKLESVLTSDMVMNEDFTPRYKIDIQMWLNPEQQQDLHASSNVEALREDFLAAVMEAFDKLNVSIQERTQGRQKFVMECRPANSRSFGWYDLDGPKIGEVPPSVEKTIPGMRRYVGMGPSRIDL